MASQWPFPGPSVFGESVARWNVYSDHSLASWRPAVTVCWPQYGHRWPPNGHRHEATRGGGQFDEVLSAERSLAPPPRRASRNEHASIPLAGHGVLESSPALASIATLSTHSNPRRPPCFRCAPVSESRLLVDPIGCAGVGPMHSRTSLHGETSFSGAPPPSLSERRGTCVEWIAFALFTRRAMGWRLCQRPVAWHGSRRQSAYCGVDDPLLVPVLELGLD